MRRITIFTSHLCLTRSSALVVLATALCFYCSGCTSLLSPVSGVPAHRLPSEFLAQPKNNLIPIDISRLRQQPPLDYLIDADDVLGIYIEGVLGNDAEPPPVSLGEPGSDLPPSIGFPIPVRGDGTLALPLISPLKVKGLTVTQIEALIRRAYTIDRQILQPEKDRIIVTIMKERTYRIVVMRQDGGLVRQTGQGTVEPLTRGEALDLPAYKNDVMHALAMTGGLPAQDAKNEIQILRSSNIDTANRDEFIEKWFSAELPDPCLCRPPLPDDSAIVKIPLRLPPGETPQFRPEDIILEDGDIILIESRERDVFYTGGLLTGGEYALPRDYDLDVVGAMAMVGQGVGNPQIQGAQGGGQGLGGFNVASIGGAAPSQLFILRRTPCDGQITIAVDLNRAIQDPSARPLVMAGDVLLLQYKPIEEALNFSIGTFFTFGVRQLLSN